MSHKLYGQSIDEATLTYSGTENTDFPVERIQDRDLNSFLLDSAPGAGTINIDIDFGASRTCDHIILGNYQFTTATAGVISLFRSSTGAFGGEETTVINQQSGVTTSDFTDKILTFASCSNRYWRLQFEELIAGNLSLIQMGVLFLGTMITFDHNPNVGKTLDHGLAVAVQESLGGNRSGRKLRSSDRKGYGWNFSYVDDDNSNLTDLETFVEDVGIDRGGGLSALPFYMSDNSGTTIYYVRAIGKYSLSEIADGIWNFALNLEQEL